MSEPLRLLLAEDSDDDAQLIVRALQTGGFQVEWSRAQTEADFVAHLEPKPDLVLADYAMPRFDAHRALQLLHERHLDIPFVVVSGAIDAEAAVALMKAGAQDYMFKHDLTRLVPVVLRELGELRSRAERARAEAALRDSEEKLRLITENVGDLIVMLDTQGRRLYASPSYHALFGDPEALPGTDSFAEIHPRDRQRVRDVFRQTVATGVGQRCEYRFLLTDGSVRHVESQGSVIVDGSGQASKVVVVSRDVTERKRAETRIQYLAHHDGLTGLPNRTLLVDRIGQAMAQSERVGHGLALLFIDLDHFKTINDSLGHETGDKLLKQVASRLRQCVRKSDTLARLGGDEFLVVQAGVKCPENAASLAHNIVAAMAEPYSVDGRVLDSCCSIGISLYPDDGQDVQTLMKNADMAMYQAKERGRNQHQFFAPEMDTRAAERLTLGNALRRALERDELVLHYQPHVELATGRIMGVEALVRWQHPELGLVSPGRFIPLAEETGLIVPIGEWVLRSACAQMRAWHERGFEELRLAVNLSARQFRQAGLTESIAAALSDTGLSARALELEITESMAMQDPDRTTTLLQELRDMGIAFAIDDFGTGYSSLSSLKRFPLRCLKIDRSFVDGIPSDVNDVAITRATLALAKSLGLHVVAEGVETDAQRCFLSEAGCQEAQGYLFSRPRPAEELEPLLAARGTPWTHARAQVRAR